MRTILEGNVVTLPRPDGKTVDVFCGKGWDNHTVFEVLDGKIRLVKGKAMDAADFRTFKSRL